jgi:hypothetical protein
MNMTTLKKLVLVSVLFPTLSFASTTGEIVSALQKDWAIANYQLTGDAQIKAYEALIEEADAAVADNANSA